MAGFVGNLSYVYLCVHECTCVFVTICSVLGLWDRVTIAMGTLSPLGPVCVHFSLP